MQVISRIGYALLRSVHFLMIAVSLPIASYYVKQDFVSTPLLPVACIGGGMWALLYFGMHGYAFPATLPGALISTLLPLINLAANGLAAATILQSAFAFVFAPLLAHTLGLGLLFFLLAIPRCRSILSIRVESWMAPFIGGMVVVFAGAVWAISQPVVSSLRSGFEASTLFVVAGGSLHITSEFRVMYDCSILANQSEQRMKRHAAWSAFTGICMAGSLILSAAIWIVN